MDRASYWRTDGVPVEAMHAHFTSHVYHRHSHESYSFGLTETGAQAFTCRNGHRRYYGVTPGSYRAAARAGAK